MVSIRLAPHDEYQWCRDGEEEKPLAATFPRTDDLYPLYHQWRTYNAEAPIIVNTHNTGTGKTKAALLRMLKRVQGIPVLSPSHDNVLLIAPTNELLAQHAEDARKFCEKNKLPYRVLMITRDDLEQYRTRSDFSEAPMRRAAVLHTVLRDGGKVDNNLDHEATIYVVNPDIFYYALYFHYQRSARATVFGQLLNNFNYLIIDEFHYYNAKQFAAFLFFIKLSEHYGYIGRVSKHRQFCILTATPNAQVKSFLDRLNLKIEWIEPGEIAESDRPYVHPVRALAPVNLYVYDKKTLESSEQSGLQSLVQQEGENISHWLRESDDEGAIISGSLGIINQINKMLTPNLRSMTGRVTGAQLREDRQLAKYQRLILATPTVDIGYNFERAPGALEKRRQNIDFLFLDAATDDELIQRIGRAGRVLAKRERDHPSRVYAVVESRMYEALKHYDGKELDRATLGQLAREHMPKRNDLYAYIATGAVLEAARPINFLGEGTADEDLPSLERFLKELMQLFDVKKPFTYEKAKGLIATFERQKKAYECLHSVPAEAFEQFVHRLETRTLNDVPNENNELERCVQAFKQRLKNVNNYEKSKLKGKRPHEVGTWLLDDLRTYSIEQARFSFRDSFQPPAALIYDPEHLHSDSPIATYNALHVIRYYHASYMDEATFNTTLRHAEQDELKLTTTMRKNSTVNMYCQLHHFRDTPLQLRLSLDVRHLSASNWEETFIACVTALYGLQIVPYSDHSSGIPREMQNLLHDQFILAFVVSKEGRLAGKLHELTREARFFPLTLEATFEDDSTHDYLVILGSMAFQVCAEMSQRIPSTMNYARFKRRIEDDSPFIC